MKKLWICMLVLCCAAGLFTPAMAETAEVRYPTDGPLMIDILWQASVDGMPMDIAASVTGTLDDGTEFFLAPDAAECVTPSGTVITQDDHGDWLRLMIGRHDAVMDVTVEYGDVMPFGAPSYLDANVEIQIYDSEENILAVIAANPDACVYTDSPFLIDTAPYYHRGGTGVWYYSFRLDHGVVKSVME